MAAIGPPGAGERINPYVFVEKHAQVESRTTAYID